MGPKRKVRRGGSADACVGDHIRERGHEKVSRGVGGGDFLETLAMIVVGPRPYMNTTFPGG